MAALVPVDGGNNTLAIAGAALERRTRWQRPLDLTRDAPPFCHARLTQPRRLTVVDAVVTTAKISSRLPRMHPVALTGTFHRAELRDCVTPPPLAADLING